METTEHSEQPEHADAMDITPALAERPSSSTQAPSLESSEGGFGLSRKRPREDSDGTYSMPSHKESSSLASDEVNQHDLMTPQPIEKVASLTQPPLQFDYELHYDSKRKPRVRSPPKKKKKDDNGYVPAGEPPVWSEVWSCQFLLHRSCSDSISLVSTIIVRNTSILQFVQGFCLFLFELDPWIFVSR